VSRTLRERVAVQARQRCGYCLTTERITGAPMEIDHIIPHSLGGPTEEDNLWLACSMCNDRKGNQIAGPDLLTSEDVRLLDPRHQAWRDHFAWSPEGDRIIGKTSCGRATVQALDLNRPVLVKSRRLWIAAGWHPPED
jgi:5-methylcytosine-specific restriction endonuclease McrA